MPMQLTKIIPPHLRRYTLEQDYSLYTEIDHAGWRYIMRVSRHFFKDHAHPKYLSGLEATGIPIERIPRITEMDECLKKLGWRAVVVSGFLPPSIFLEFLSLGILPIACDMRSIDHLSYTPAPDIVHEAAGHAPIIADPDYSRYLRHYGEIAKKVIFTDEDVDVYEAIRNLSEVKEDPLSTENDIELSIKRLEKALNSVTSDSEATLLSRMAWWTTEYGLVGPISNPLIYGAGLLSSVGESFDCFQKNVPRVPLTVDCVKQSYDITKPQPYLFVTPDFQTLNDVLEELAETMAFKRGGIESLTKAVAAKTITTVEFNTGLQLSGKLSEIAVDKKERLSFLTWTGPCQFSFEDKEIPGEGPNKWKDGFCSPIGKLKNLPMGLWSLADLSQEHLEEIGLNRRDRCSLEFESGIIIEGRLSSELRVGGKLLMIGLTDAQTEQYPVDPPLGEELFILCATEIPSVFGDAADRVAFYNQIKSKPQEMQKQKTNAPHHPMELRKLYAEIRSMRENKKDDPTRLKEINEILEARYPKEWLLRLEILEFFDEKESTLEKTITARLTKLMSGSSELKALIERGLSLHSSHGISPRPINS